MPSAPVSARSDAAAYAKAYELSVSKSSASDPLTSDETQTSTPLNPSNKPNQPRREKLEAERIARETRVSQAKGDSEREALRAWKQEVKVWHKSVRLIKEQTKVLIDAIRKESDVLLTNPALTAEQKSEIRSSRKTRIKLALSFAQESLAQLGAAPPKPLK